MSQKGFGELSDFIIRGVYIPGNLEQVSKYLMFPTFNGTMLTKLWILKSP